MQNRQRKDQRQCEYIQMPAISSIKKHLIEKRAPLYTSKLCWLFQTALLQPAERGTEGTSGEPVHVRTPTPTLALSVLLSISLSSLSLSHALNLPFFSPQARLRGITRMPPPLASHRRRRAACVFLPRPQTSIIWVSLLLLGATATPTAPTNTTTPMTSRIRRRALDDSSIAGAMESSSSSSWSSWSSSWWPWPTPITTASSPAPTRSPRAAPTPSPTLSKLDEDRINYGAYVHEHGVVSKQGNGEGGREGWRMEATYDIGHDIHLPHKTLLPPSLTGTKRRRVPILPLAKKHGRGGGAVCLGRFLGCLYV